MLNRALAGDPEALTARDGRILIQTPEALIGHVDNAVFKRYPNFFGARNEFKAFCEEQYGWLHSPLSDASVFKKPPSLDQMLDRIIGTSLGDYGFDLKRRKKKKSEWKCTSNLLPVEMAIYFDKARWVMTANLDIPDLPYHADLASLFFFAQIGFEYGRQNFEEHLLAFFSEYGKIFPHVVEAVEKAIAIRDAYLCGDRARSRLPVPPHHGCC